MEWIANQPVQFGIDEPCGTCDEIINQLSDNNDEIQVQFRINNCGSVQLVEDFLNYPYNTWVLQDGWSIDGGAETLCHSGNLTLNARVDLPVASFPAGYYQFTIVVTSFNGVGAMAVKYGVFPSYVLLGQITGVGTWNFYHFIVPNAANKLVFIPTATGVEMCMNEISVYRILTDAIVSVYNADTNIYTGAKRSYVSNPSDFIFYEDTVTITLNWANMGVSDECNYLCLFDPCLNSNGQNYSATILNPLFAGNADSWTLSGDATYFDEAIDMGSAPSELSQEGIFNAFINQCVKINVPGISGTLNIFFGDNQVGTITSPGITTICGIPTVSLGIHILSPGGTTATIESVLPITRDELNVVIPFPTSLYVCNQQSNSFKIADYANVCTQLISASNNENGMGFVFGSSGFVPKIRLESKLKGMKYPSERTSYESSLGSKIVTYFSGRKAKTFCVDLQPEYVHDFLRLLFGFDNFYIDSILYFVEDDEYNIEINEANDNVGSVKLLVSTRIQDVKNTNC